MPYQENGVKFYGLRLTVYGSPLKICHLLSYYYWRLPSRTSEMKEVSLLIYFFLSPFV
jgi:hypothetical protein